MKICRECGEPLWDKYPHRYCQECRIIMAAETGSDVSDDELMHLNEMERDDHGEED